MPETTHSHCSVVFRHHVLCRDAISSEYHTTLWRHQTQNCASFDPTHWRSHHLNTQNKNHLNTLTLTPPQHTEQHRLIRTKTCVAASKDSMSETKINDKTSVFVWSLEVSSPDARQAVNDRADFQWEEALSGPPRSQINTEFGTCVTLTIGHTITKCHNHTEK